MKKAILTIAAIIIIFVLALYEISNAADVEKTVVKEVEVKTEYIKVPKVKEVYRNVISNEPMKMTVTGYTAGPESTGKSPGHPLYGVTATGTKVKEPTAATPGTCAVDPDVIELGTTLYVEGYGLCKAEDTGSAVNGYHVDVYLETVEQVYKQIGKGKRNVWILEDWGH